jgi:proton glutamate symport protein
MEKKMLKTLLKPLKHPVTILIATIVGIILGTFFPRTVPYITPLGLAIGTLLRLCIEPLIITSIILGLAKIIKAKLLIKRLSMTIIVFLIGILLPGIVGFGFGMLHKSTIHFNDHTQIQLSRLIKVTEYYSEKKTQTQEKQNLTIKSFIDNFVPHNIFAALSNQLTIKLIIIAILLGVALGFLDSPKTTEFLKFIELFHSLFDTLFDWIFYAIPFAACALFAKTAAVTNIDILDSLTSFILTLYAGGILLFIIYHIIISKQLQCSFIRTFLIFKKALFHSFILGSSFIALPETKKRLKESGVAKNVVDLLFPLGLIINQHGKILLFAMLTMHILGFYHIHLPLYTLIGVFFITLLSGVAAQGKGSSVILSYAIVVNTLGIPHDLANLMLMIIIPLVIKLIETLNLYANCAIVALVGTKVKQTK